MVQIVTSGFANEAIQLNELRDNVADVTEGMSAFKNGKGAEKARENAAETGRESVRFSPNSSKFREMKTLVFVARGVSGFLCVRRFQKLADSKFYSN